MLARQDILSPRERIEAKIALERGGILLG